MEEPSLTPRIDSPNHPREELEEMLQASPGAAALKFTVETASGVVPIIGGAMSAATSAWSEREQARFNNLAAIWFQRLEGDLRAMGLTMAEVMNRLDLEDERVKTRVESPEYQALVNKAMRNWDSKQSEEKRVLIRNLLANAAGENITSDDVITMFISWIEDYSETHFKVIKAIYLDEGLTKAAIWESIHGERVRDDSAEADLFKYIMNQLSQGYVVRIQRQSDHEGRWIKVRTAKRSPSNTLKSPFDDKDPMVLTDLGRQFVHYALEEIVVKLGSGEAGTP
jgi:hypothetical protein